MHTYRYVAVDHSLTAVAARFGTNLDALWALNDSARHFRRAQEWAHSVTYTQQLIVATPEADARWEWDLFDADEGNITLEEFCNHRAAEREQRRRRGLPVGPTPTPELIWYALLNEDFRYQQLLREGHRRGATSQDVQNLEDQPQIAYIRSTSAVGLFVPVVPVSPQRPVAAVPSGAARVLVTIPHWVRELMERRADIEQAATELRELMARERAVRAELADALTTFARLDELLRILVEGRSGASQPHTYAAADAGTLEALAGLRRSLFRVQQRVADLGRRRREAVVSPRAGERRSTRLRTLIQDRAFSALYRRAVVEDAHAYGERVAPAVQATVLSAYRLAVEAGLPWAESDVHAALAPTQAWWQTTAQWLPLATALFVPMFGNLAGPPSVAVWLAQWRAARELSGVLTNLGANQSAELRATMQNIVTRWAGARRLVVTLEQYEAWLARATASENAFNAVLHAEPVAPGVEVGAAGTVRVGAAPATGDDFILAMSQWTAESEAALATRDAVRGELTPAQQAAGLSTLELKNQVMAVLEDASLTAAQRSTRLRNLANGNLTGGVQTGNLATGGLLVLNLLAIAAGIVNFLGQPDHSLVQYAEFTTNMLGGTATSALAVLQLFANRAEGGWAATFLEAHAVGLGRVAAGLALAQSIAGLVSTLDTYGTSHHLTLAVNLMSIGSAALLFSGWAATLEGIGAGASLTGIGLGLGFVAAGLGIVVGFVGEDAPTKLFFVGFLANFGGSQTVERLDGFLAESPDTQTMFRLAIHDVRVAAQHLTFPLAVWEETNQLTYLGFSLPEAQQLTAPRPSYLVGPLDPAVAREAFVRQVNATFHPTG